MLELLNPPAPTVKLENIMFENNDPDAEIKVIDFGLSHKFISNEKKTMTQLAGTIYTMAPQVLQVCSCNRQEESVWSTKL